MVAPTLEQLCKKNKNQRRFKANGGAGKEPPEGGVWLPCVCLGRGSSTPDPRLPAALDSCPQPRQPGSGGWLGWVVNSQKLCQALSQGEIPKPGKQEGKAAVRPPFLPHFPHLFGTPGWIKGGGAEIQRKLFISLSAPLLYLSVDGLGKHLSHLENTSLMKIENIVS